MKTRMLAVILALGLPSVALADKNKPDTSENMQKTDKNEKSALADSDQKVLAHLHAVNQMEIDVSKIAMTNGTTQVKQFATTMVRDHGKADKDIADFAKKHGMKQIAPDESMTEADKKDLMEAETKLKGLKGAEFDREYLKMMVEGHDKELAKIDTEIGDVQDPDLKKMLTDLKPTLQKHADEARKLQANAPVSQQP